MANDNQHGEKAQTMIQPYVASLRAYGNRRVCRAFNQKIRHNEQVPPANGAYEEASLNQAWPNVRASACWRKRTYAR